MAPNLTQLTDLIARLTDYPLPSAQVLMRAGREGKPKAPGEKPTPMLSSGGRGRNVVKATAADAANLLIAMLACPNPSRAVEYMQDFGDLEKSNTEVRGMGDFNRSNPEMIGVYIAAEELRLGSTFRESIARLLDALGDPVYAKAIAPHLIKSLKGDIQPPTIEITIWDTSMMGAIRVDAVTYVFRHKQIANIKKGADLDEIQHRYAEEGKVSEKYRRNVFSSKQIGGAVIFPVAELLSGVRIQDLLTKELEGERDAGT